MPGITYVRLYTDDAGESHFGEVWSPLKPADFAPPAPPLDLASPVGTEHALLASAPVGWYGDWHPSPARQFYIQLSGQLEAETSDGEKRTFSAGSIVLLEDTTGKGHRSRVVGDEPVRMMFVQLSDKV